MRVGEENRFTCGPARASLYTCKDGHFRLATACPAGKTCTYSEGDVAGDTHKGPLVMLPKLAECK